MLEELSNPELGCDAGAADCICEQLHHLHQLGELRLFHGRVARTCLERALDFPANSLVGSSKNKRRGPSRRCVDRFDEFLSRNGYGSAWVEKIPKIRKYLEQSREAKSLPVNHLGRLNRSKVLKKFGLGNNSASIVQMRCTRVKEVLDEFDQLSEVESRARYKHSDLEDKLAEILALPELKLTHGRLINLVWVGKRLGVNPNSIVRTPNLKGLIDAKTQEIERRCRQGVTSKSFQIGGVDH